MFQFHHGMGFDRGTGFDRGAVFDKRRRAMLSPARTIVVSFAAVILTGTLLLMLPIASKSGTFTPFVNALFTATSATCVTGLIVYDTFTHWSHFGQVVILLLIQIGGLGLVTFTTFFNILIGRKLGLRGMKLAQESISTDSLAGLRGIIKMVVLVSLCIELIGAVGLSTVFVPKYGRRGIFISLFLAISAFCNAGFDILGFEGQYVSLTNYNSSPVVLGTISLLIIVGGLGFVVWHDLWEYHKTRKLILHTKVVLTVTAFLLVTGFVAFLAIEYKNPMTMGAMPWGEKMLAAAFQSVTCRTAGFNSIPMEGLLGASKVFSIILMFIGAAPGSTAGGIKVTTLAVVVMTVLSVVQGNDDTIIAHRKINAHAVYKALTIMMLSLFAVAVCSGVIYFTMEQIVPDISGLDVVFEEVSAFATVGLTAGVSGIANTASKAMLIFSMFFGRVGPVSLALSLSLRGPQSRKEVAPEGKIIL